MGPGVPTWIKQKVCCEPRKLAIMATTVLRVVHTYAAPWWGDSNRSTSTVLYISQNCILHISSGPAVNQTNYSSGRFVSNFPLCCLHYREFPRHLLRMSRSGRMVAAPVYGNVEERTTTAWRQHVWNSGQLTAQYRTGDPPPSRSKQYCQIGLTRNVFVVRFLFFYVV